MNVLRKLKEDATWWAVSPDGFGGDTFAAPVKIKCRWEDRQELVAHRIDAGLHEFISNAVVYVDRDMKNGDYLVRGDQTLQSNPTTVAGALKIKRFDRLTDLRNVDVLRMAVL